MKEGLPETGFWKQTISKIKNPFCIIMIVILYILNYYIRFIKYDQLVAGLCIIFICIVLLRDTIVKCVDRICKRDETIAKYKLEQKNTKYEMRQKCLDRKYKRDETIANEKTIQKYTKYKINQTDSYSNTEETNNDRECPIYEIKRHKNKIL